MALNKQLFHPFNKQDSDQQLQHQRHERTLKMIVNQRCVSSRTNNLLPTANAGKDKVRISIDGASAVKDDADRLMLYTCRK